ncbi:hypothetical protein B0H14DRAFT_2672398 [Mycena olivaceomarginata]|nr:hypothetical protein B0H14DRAFT_2672398 [Mycena olivaceomarginata]
MARSIFIALGLAVLISPGLCAHDVLRSRHNNLERKPLDDSQLISGLLNRADACTTCGIGGVCCSNNKCCGVAQRCCSGGGCCQISESCATVDGIKGCCPVGATCTVPGHSSTPTPTAPHSAISSVPTPTASSQQDVVVDMSGSGPSWSGSWVATTSSCDSSGTSRTVSSDGVTEAEFSSLSYSFYGSAIYVRTSSYNANYLITLDGNATNYGVAPARVTPPANCTYGWWLDNLDSTFHYLSISVSSGGASTAAAVEPFTFELHNFVVAKNATSTSSSSSRTGTSSAQATGGTGSGSGSADTGGTSTAGTSSVVVGLIFGLWTVLLL